ncbi:hypothetical protein JCM15765_03990 [Paradesulfitobacterium aromaticivorans]
MRTIGERSNSEYELYQRMGEKWGTDIRVAMPGIIQSFDPAEQTVMVQPAIKERVVDQSGNIQMVSLPLLLDVPIVIPRAGGIVLTMAIQQGDECLVIFADSCIDAWWVYGDVQTQAEKRRHDLSDAFAILGTWSQPKRITNYSTTSAQLRTEDGAQCIDISSSGIDLRGNITKNGVPL